MDYNRDGTVLVEKSLGELEQYFLRFGTLPWADYYHFPFIFQPATFSAVMSEKISCICKPDVLSIIQTTVSNH